MVLTSEDGQETPLTAMERETRGLQIMKFSLRATVMADCKTAKVYVSIIPVGAREVKGKISAWGVEMSEFPREDTEPAIGGEGEGEGEEWGQQVCNGADGGTSGAARGQC